MSQKQLKTLTVINRFIDKSIFRQQAAELLGLSTRQITRLKKGVLDSGAESLIHKNTGRKPAHAVSAEIKEAVIMIYSHLGLSKASFLHFKDILLADFGISISYSALSSILKNAGFESPKKKKSGTAHTAGNAGHTPDSSFRLTPPLTNGLAAVLGMPCMAPLMMPPGRSLDFFLPGMNAFMDIWKPCDSAALTSAFPRRFILITTPSSAPQKLVNSPQKN